MASPEHVVPSPVYPVLQVQVKVPAPVFAHVALLSHGLEEQAIISRSKYFQIVNLDSYDVMTENHL